MFRKSLIVSAVFLGALFCVSWVNAQSVYLVTITDIRKVDAWEVMTRDEINKLQKEISEETKVFPAALEEAKKVWKEDELYKKTPFPSAYVVPRKITMQGPFTNREMANKKKLAKEEFQGDKAVKLAKERARMKAKNEAELIKQQNIDKAVERVNEKLKEMLKREVPLNGF